MQHRFFMPPMSLMGAGCLEQAGKEIKKMKFKRALIVTCKPIIESELINDLTSVLEKNSIEYVVYDKAKAKPDIANIQDGIKVFANEECDFVISFGGNSTRNCAKGISVMLTCDEEGYCKSDGNVPLVAVNVTSFMTGEMPIFTQKVKDKDEKVLIDRSTTPIITVTDSNLLKAMSNRIMGAIGVDALRHAVEAYTSDASTPITDACAFQSIKILGESLEIMINGKKTSEICEQITYANYLAGIAYNNTILGHMYALDEKNSEENMYSELKAEIPIGSHQTFSQEKFSKKMMEVAFALGQDVKELDQEQAMEYVMTEIKRLSDVVGIPSGMCKDERVIFGNKL